MTRLCKRCKFRPARKYSQLCELCSSNDKHRHHNRQKTEMVISVDSEGFHDDSHIMRLFTFSYGREDGTSGSILTGNAKEALLWIAKIAGEDYNGQKQVFHSFHFNYDIAVLTREDAFDRSKMFLVHKARARNTNLLCNYKRVHKPGERHTPFAEPCDKIHRHDQEYIQSVIAGGGEGDIIAYDPESHLAIAASPKRRLYVEYRPEGDRYEGHIVIDIHDHGSAFVGGLENVIDTWQPEMSPEQRAIVKWGKAARKVPGMLEANPEKTMAYSEAECVLDARCVRLLIETIKEATGIIIKPSKLYGSGSIAGSAFDYHHMIMRKDVHDDGTQEAEFIAGLAEWTYFGGLIETPVVGLVSASIDSEDINSAYPSHAVELPCMRQGHGHWERGKVRQIPSTALVGYVLANWSVQTPSTPPFVVHTTEKAVRQPLTGSNIWVTLPEYRAAFDRFGFKGITPTDAYWWVQECDCPNPLAWMEELYAKRLAIKAQMKGLEEGTDEWQALNVRQEAIKLVLNSCYGKLAQMRPEPGKYTNLHYAAYITGATRAQLRNRTWHKEDMGGIAVYQHTDSVKFLNAPLEDEGKGLGKWGGEKPKHGLIILQPGLAAPVSEGEKGASRGVNAQQFYTEARRWATENDLTQPPNTWPVLEVPGERMISARMAHHRKKPMLAGSFQPHPMKIRPSETKRDLKNARPMPGEPRAWIVPPIKRVDNPASLEDLRNFRKELLRKIQEGEFDDKTHN